MRLSSTEYEIMQIIWAKGGSVTSRDILALSQARGWKQPTVLSFLKRLCEKGLLTTEKKGKLRSYRPAVTRQEYARSETRALLDELYDGKMSDLIACMTGQTELTETERRQLEKLLEGEWQ